MALNATKVAHQSPFVRRNAQTIDLSSTDATFAIATNQIYVGGTGDLKVDFIDGDSDLGLGVTFKAVPVGMILNISVTKIYKTGTTATTILALW